MDLLNNLLMIAQVLSALGVIVLVLMQHGKGADMGAAFGSGSSGSLFGATGSANFLSRTTGLLATVFFVCTLALALLANQRPEAPGSIMQGVTTQPAAPAAPAQPSDIPPAQPSDIPPAGSGAGQPAAGQSDAGQAPAGVPAPAPVDDVPK
ncbi:MAG: preprotein translocase subunit SecG [Limnobacter sp.]|nr:preprotein translocase subunit SecG [Limnobacter sp.]